MTGKTIHATITGKVQGVAYRTDDNESGVESHAYCDPIPTQLSQAGSTLIKLPLDLDRGQHSPPGSSARRSTARTPIGPRKAGGPHRNLSTL